MSKIGGGVGVGAGVGADKSMGSAPAPERGGIELLETARRFHSCSWVGCQDNVSSICTTTSTQNLAIPKKRTIIQV